MKVQIVVKDITGAVHAGAVTEATDEYIHAVKELLSDFSDLNHLALSLEDQTMYFNPRHVVYVGIVEVG